MRRFNKIKLYGFVLLFIFFALYLFYQKQPSFEENELMELKKLINYDAATFSNSSCQFDTLNPFDKTILKYFKKEAPIQCFKSNGEETVVVNGNHLEIIPRLLNLVSCEGRPFEFKPNVKDNENIYGNWLGFNKKGIFVMETDFVNVRCFRKGIFKTQILDKSFAIASPKRDKTFGDESIDGPSVVLIGIDSLSRSHFIRSLPKTYQYLIDNNFIDFKKHLKVADNTYGNWIAILTGLRGTWSTEFPLELKDDWSMWFDSYPFIWQQFNSQGYATFFAEDRADIATLNYMGKLFGFKTQPTDYYFRPFWIDVEERINFKQSKFGCYQGQINTKIQLDYLSQFLDIYKDKKKFVWWWSTEMSHDSFNAISSMDDIYLNFLKQNEKKLENSVVVLFSDHGNRYDSIRETIVGRYENRMPFLGVKLPKSLNEFNPELIKMMKANSQKMTTQFDLHAFLNSLLNKEWDTKVSERRAYSLLHEHPNNRTCLNAQIPATYCPCNQEIILSVDQAQDAINVLMRLLNEKLKNFSNFIKNDKKYKCMPFSLKEVSYVSLTVPSSSILIDQQTGGKDLPKNINVIYRIMLQMASPSNALIEALLEKNLGTGKYRIKEGIERNNKYGKSSYCVNDAEMQKICYCVEFD